jgi:exodeoxyribonuclease-3
MRNYLKLLDSKKPIVYCGDLNVAHQEIDLKNPKSNRGNAGFTDEEREKMTQLLDSNFIDTFRYKYPDKADEYTWWSYMGHVRERNIGWRIYYFVVSDRIKDKIIDAKIHQSVMGSDHCPIELDLDI